MIKQIESVQHRAARFITGNFDFDPGSMTKIMESIKLTSLAERRRQSRLILFYKGLKSEANIPINDLQKPKPQKSPGKERHDNLPQPKFEIYPASKICLEWRRKRGIGSGLVNLGNTCFLNSTLQCLSYTAPLANYCLSDEHTNTCRKNQNGMGFCCMCAMQQHVRKATQNSGHSISPHGIINKLHLIAKHFKCGRQEDAHEFLRYIIDNMQKATMISNQKLDRFSKATTVIDQIFGGYLRSRVTCRQCREKFDTYDPFMDIGLDIKNCETVEQAFTKFFKPENLDQENAYTCPNCKRKVQATKCFSIHKPSNILTLQIKRFDHNKIFNKITRHISFPNVLNIRPYMNIRQGEEIKYHLYGVLVHSGHSVHMGHYYCFVKSSAGTWFVMNDASVQPVPAARVHNAEAYLLFYCRNSSTVPNNSTPQKPTGALIGPQMPKGSHHTNSGDAQKCSNGLVVPPDLGQLLERKPNPRPMQLIKKVSSSSTTMQQSQTPPTSQQPVTTQLPLTKSVPIPTQSQSLLSKSLPVTKPPVVATTKPPHPSASNIDKDRCVISFGIRPKTIGKDQTPVKYTDNLINGLGMKNMSLKSHPTKSESNTRLVPYDDDNDQVNGDSKENGLINETGDDVANSSNENKNVKESSASLHGKFNHKCDSRSVPLSPKRTVLTKPVKFNTGNSDDFKLKKENSDLDSYQGMMKYNSNKFVPRQIGKKSDKPSIKSPENLSQNGEFKTVQSSVTHEQDNKSELGSKTFVGKLEMPHKTLRADGLICNTSPQKINASSHWVVQNQDCIKSPSISSNCSNTSVNSTSEWHVHEADSSKVIDRRKSYTDHKTYSVSDNKLVKQDSKVSTDGKKYLTKGDPHADYVKVTSDNSGTLKQRSCSDTSNNVNNHRDSLSSTKEKSRSKSKENDVKIDTDEKVVQWNGESINKNNVSVSAIEKSIKEQSPKSENSDKLKRKHKEHESLLHKLHKKTHHEKQNYKFHKLVESDSRDSSPTKKHKKEKRKRNHDDPGDSDSKHRKTDRRHSDDSHSDSKRRKKDGDKRRKIKVKVACLKRKRVRSDSDSSTEWVVRTDFSGSQSGTDFSETEHKTLKRPSNVVPNKPTSPSINHNAKDSIKDSHKSPEKTSSNYNSATEKYKSDNHEMSTLLKHTTNHENDHAASSIETHSHTQNFTGDSSPTHHTHNHSLSTKQSKQREESVEHLKDGDASSKTSLSSPTKSVSVQRWDKQHDRTSLYNRHENGSDQSNDLVAQLEKMSSVHGYGNSVTSWEGGTSKVDAEHATDGHYADDSDLEYDMELDRGKSKKIKTPKITDGKTGNLFQKTYDDRREGKFWNTHVSKKGDQKYKVKSSSPHFKERTF